MAKRWRSGSVLVCAMLLLFAPAARAQQTLNFSLGYFAVKGEDARTDGDVLNVNHTYLVFDISDFNGASIGGEWLMPLNRYFEGGIGVSFTRRTVDSVYQDYVDNDGTEIDQKLRLRQVPIAFTVRFTPLGPSSPVQPFIGAGLGVINWRYSESGEFVDFDAGNVIFEDTFRASGTATGPVILGGIRFASDRFSAGGEVRFHAAEADLSSDFAGSKIDLGGWTYNFTVGYRF